MMVVVMVMSMMRILLTVSVVSTAVDEFGQMSMFAQQHSSQKAETEMEQYYQLLIGPRILQHQLDSLVHLLYFL